MYLHFVINLGINFRVKVTEEIDKGNMPKLRDTL